MLHQIKSFEDFVKLKNKGCQIIDLSKPDAFALGHIPGSLNIYSERFAEIAPEFILKDQAILLTSDEDIYAAYNQMEAFSKFNNIKGFYHDAFQHWSETLLPIDVVLSLTAEEVWFEYKHGNLQLFDIRQSADVEIKRLDEAHHLEYKRIITEYEQMNENINACFLCSDGALSMTLLSFLKIKGYHTFYHAAGGIDVLSDSGYFTAIREKNKS